MRTLKTDTDSDMPLFVEVTRREDDEPVGLNEYVDKHRLREAMYRIGGPGGTQLYEAALHMAELCFFRDQNRDAWDAFKEQTDE